MVLTLQQIDKRPYSSEFVLIRNSKAVGSVFLEGNICTVLGELAINFFGHTYILAPNGVRGIFRQWAETTYRPFDIFVDRAQYGHIYYDKCVGNSNMSTGYACKLRCEQKEYVAYIIECESKEVKIPIYCENKQVALITRDFVDTEGMGNFILYVAEETDAPSALFILGYIYTCSLYRAGEKSDNDCIGYSYVTTQPNILSKINPDFIETVKP